MRQNYNANREKIIKQKHEKLCYRQKIFDYSQKRVILRELYSAINVLQSAINIFTAHLFSLIRRNIQCCYQNIITLIFWSNKKETKKYVKKKIKKKNNKNSSNSAPLPCQTL